MPQRRDAGRDTLARSAFQALESGRVVRCCHLDLHRVTRRALGEDASTFRPGAANGRAVHWRNLLSWTYEADLSGIGFTTLPAPRRRDGRALRPAGGRCPPRPAQARVFLGLGRRARPPALRAGAGRWPLQRSERALRCPNAPRNARRPSGHIHTAISAGAGETGPVPPASGRPPFPTATRGGRRNSGRARQSASTVAEGEFSRRPGPVGRGKSHAAQTIRGRPCHPTWANRRGPQGAACFAGRQRYQYWPAGSPTCSRKPTSCRGAASCGNVTSASRSFSRAWQGEREDRGRAKYPRRSLASRTSPSGLPGTNCPAACGSGSSNRPGARLRPEIGPQSGTSRYSGRWTP